MSFLPPINAWFRFILASYPLALVKAVVVAGFVSSERYLYVGDADEKGQGLFTRKGIKKGNIVLIAKGRTRYFKSMTKDDCYLYPDWFSVDLDIWVDPSGVYTYMNHTCNPNMGTKDGRIFIALRDIQSGEELTFDYSTTDDEIDWEMACLCKKPGCRGKIGGIQTLPRETFESLKEVTPKHFQKIYVDHHNRNNLNN